MKFLSFVVLSLAFSMNCFAGQENKGGVTIKRNGMYLTINSANVTLEPLSNVPGEQVVEQAIRDLKISDQDRLKLLRVVRPSLDRHYYYIPSISPELKKTIIAAYSKILSVLPNDEIVVVGVTNGEDTYLLPEFQKLQDDISKAAIDFHEAIWAFDSGRVHVHQTVTELDLELRAIYGYDPSQDLDINERFVEGAEVAFERFLRRTDDVTIYKILAELFDERSIYFSALVDQDVRTQAFGPSTPNAGIPWSYLFGTPVAQIYHESCLPKFNAYILGDILRLFDSDEYQCHRTGSREQELANNDRSWKMRSWDGGFYSRLSPEFLYSHLNKYPNSLVVQYLSKNSYIKGYLNLKEIGNFNSLNYSQWLVQNNSGEVILYSPEKSKPVGTLIF